MSPPNMYFRDTLVCNFLLFCYYEKKFIKLLPSWNMMLVGGGGSPKFVHSSPIATFGFRINYFISLWGQSYGFVWVTNRKVNSLKFKSRGKWWRTLQSLKWARIGPEPQLAYAMQMFSCFIGRLKVPFSLQQRVCLLLQKVCLGKHFPSKSFLAGSLCTHV